MIEFSQDPPGSLPVDSNKDLRQIDPRNVCLVFLCVLIVSEGPELFRKVRADAGIHFRLVSSKSDPGRPDYDPLNKCLINEVLSKK